MQTIYVQHRGRKGVKEIVSALKRVLQNDQVTFTAIDREELKDKTKVARGSEDCEYVVTITTPNGPISASSACKLGDKPYSHVAILIKHLNESLSQQNVAVTLQMQKMPNRIKKYMEKLK